MSGEIPTEAGQDASTKGHMMATRALCPSCLQPCWLRLPAVPKASPAFRWASHDPVDYIGEFFSKQVANFPYHYPSEEIYKHHFVLFHRQLSIAFGKCKASVWFSQLFLTSKLRGLNEQSTYNYLAVDILVEKLPKL